MEYIMWFSVKHIHICSACTLQNFKKKEKKRTYASILMFKIKKIKKNPYIYI